MKEYIIKKVPGTAPIWSEAEEVLVDTYPWGCPFEDPPQVAAMLQLTDQGLHVLMACDETDPRATYTENNDPVCRDSCLECFLSAGDGGYLNFECNANGAIWSAFGPDRHHRQFLRDLGLPEPKVTVHKSPVGWGVEYCIPQEVFTSLYGHSLAAGDTFCANFYKCGDDTAVPHYAVWNPVVAEAPDYHRPECFGMVRIEGE